ncbi:response regulator transcription factor [Salisediminibacterium halotolerans]|uniref:Two-component system, OmpR family, response regulator n=1 Tax=Salisediminibacterium halotolerans TaxID=517425 RepID=A0A1H9VNS4_9BACI|nr:MULTISPECIES: response regulator transcription factor [Salisediminibacterium]RLJ75421.1 two-component system OmpR family response regulator [Actinophytocola xinjiangensis]RPE89274.1 two-component system OmpR family response regulator [Salisediminibacterium halotolerans]TWG36034.1 two-component system OmpR family response regulator [Salisediminibacterium halotolerans]SES23228.1 two-component system, OmpR family, response regulator [Salisediminibacterium haloalkalitolerans]GEL07491.1 DNA-bind
MKKQNILIVDDEEQMRELVSSMLTDAGYSAFTAADGDAALDLLNSQAIDFIILDILMPGMDGYETCKTIRQTSSVPIMMLTAKTEEEDKVAGLKLGADDYLVKPFGKDELIARMEAVLRRVGIEQTAELNGPDTLTFHNISLNRTSKKAYVKNELITLTKKEFELLELFLQHPEQVFSRERILELIWGMDYLNATSRTVDTHVKTLRLKLKSEASCIQTVWGMGYKLEVPGH